MKLSTCVLNMDRQQKEGVSSNTLEGFKTYASHLWASTVPQVKQRIGNDIVLYWTGFVFVCVLLTDPIAFFACSLLVCLWMAVLTQGMDTTLEWGSIRIHRSEKLLVLVFLTLSVMVLSGIVLKIVIASCISAVGGFIYSLTNSLR